MSAETDKRAAEPRMAPVFDENTMERRPGPTREVAVMLDYERLHEHARQANEEYYKAVVEWIALHGLSGEQP